MAECGNNEGMETKRKCDANGRILGGFEVVGVIHGTN